MILGIITAVLIASNILILAAYLVARDECKIFAERSDVAESIIKDLQDEICKMNQHLSDRVNEPEKALCAVLDAEDLDACKDKIREEVSK